IGREARIVVQQSDSRTKRRRKYASAHDLRRGLAERLINAGVSAETLKVVMRHRDFGTTEKHYGALRSAQSAGQEIVSRLVVPPQNSELVGGLVGGPKKTPQLSAEELLVLKSLLARL
ncbi:MAG: tyrosine-type recombinase/integrase, partial [Planctomyces sp.]